MDDTAPTLSLIHVIGETNTEPGAPEQFLQKDLQDLTSLLACAVAAAICRGDEIPPGLTGRFEAAFSQPTPGKLNEFIGWCSQILPEETAPCLRTSMIEQNKGSSWLKTMTSFRNQWAHPKDESRVTILEKVQGLLQSIPDVLLQPRLEVSNVGEVVWREEESAVVLAPFIRPIADTICFVTERASDGEWRFNSSTDHASQIFAGFWFNQRIRDPQLLDPTADEVLAKTKKHGGPFDREFPWWSPKLLAGNAPGFIAETIPPVANSSDSKIDADGPLALEIELESGATVNELISAALGLAGPPSNEELMKWCDQTKQLIVLARGENLSPRDLLQVLYWLADIRDRSLSPKLKLVISRSSDQLEADQEVLWDRLPDNLDSILQPPPKSKRAGLQDYLWPADQPKRLFGLF